MSVADAYVDLHVNGDGLAGEVRTSLRGVEDDVDRDLDRTGNSFGQRLAASFVTGFKKRFGGGSSGGGIGTFLKNSFKGFNPRRLFIPALVAAIPLLTSTISALAGTLTALTGAVVQAGGASLAFVGILGSLIQGLIVGKIAFSGFSKAVGGDTEAMKALSPAAQAAAKAVRGLKDEWKAVTATIQNKVFAGLGDDISRIGDTLLPLLQKQLGGTGDVLNRIIKDVIAFGTSRSFVERFGKALQNNNGILENLGKAVVPALDGVLNIFLALQPAARRLSEIIVKVVRNFSEMAGKASTADRINDFLTRAFDSASKLWKILKNLGEAIINIFSAATGPGNKLLGTLGKLAKQFNDWTNLASTRSSIAEWARQGIDTTGKLFGIIGRLWKIVQPLFNPQFAGTVFSVFETALPAIVSVGTAIKEAVMPVLQSLINAWGNLGPAVGDFVSAIAPLLKGVGAVVGQLIEQTFGFVATILRVVTPVVKIISGILGPILQKFAPVIAFLIFAFTNWSSTIIKLIPFVGRFTAPIVRLAEYLYDKFIPAIQFIGKVVSKVIPPIAKVFKSVFGFIWPFIQFVFAGISKVVSVYMKIVLKVISVVWNAIKAVIVPVLTFLGKFIGTYIKIWWKVVSTVMKAIWAVLVRAWKAIVAVVGPAVKFIAEIVKRYFGIVKAVVSSVAGFLTRVFVQPLAKIWNLFKTGFERIISFITSLPQKILALASSFLDAGTQLGSKIISGLWAGLKAAGGAVANFGQAIKDAINSALHLPVSIKGPGPLPDFNIPAFAQGGLSRGGLALVGERGPELVNLPRDSRVYSNQQSQNMMGRPRETMPRKMTLRVGDREFTAFLEEIADGRIAAADSLAWQGE